MNIHNYERNTVAAAYDSSFADLTVALYECFEQAGPIVKKDVRPAYKMAEASMMCVRIMRDAFIKHAPWWYQPYMEPCITIEYFTNMHGRGEDLPLNVFIKQGYAQIRKTVGILGGTRNIRTEDGCMEIIGELGYVPEDMAYPHYIACGQILAICALLQRLAVHSTNVSSLKLETYLSHSTVADVPDTSCRATVTTVGVMGYKTYVVHPVQTVLSAQCATLAKQDMSDAELDVYYQTGRLPC